MPRSIAYDRQTIDNPNPLARFSHRSRLRISLSVVESHVAQGSRLLDVGAGTGAFLHRLRQTRPDIEGIAFEPFMDLQFSDIVRETDLRTLADASFDAVCAFEVLEHLAEPILDDFIIQARRILKPAGKLVVSVPIMEGLGLPLKEASRMLLFRRRTDYRAAELLRGFFGLPVLRASDPLTSHKGFAHRGLHARLLQNFRPIGHLHSPFPVLPWWANSQIFGVFGLR